MTNKLSSQNLRQQMVPWAPDPGRLIKTIQKQLPHDALAFGVIHGQRSKLDELIMTRGWSQDAMSNWFASGTTQDSLCRVAKRRGLAVATSDELEGDYPLKGYRHNMALMIPESLSGNRWWWLLVARNKKPFDDDQQQLASFLLRQWQVRFDQQDEPLSGRMLVGQDDRLIHADPWTQTLLLEQPDFLNHLLETLHSIRGQRWGEASDLKMHDFAVQLARRIYWICFRSHQAVNQSKAAHWYLELRQLESDELPAVGWLEDDRIAEAIAYIHDHFHESPNLDQIAKSVHLSPFHFHRLFSKYVGMSPKHYLQRKQLQVAKWLLRSSRSSVGSIAKQCGFSSHGHFTSTFSRLITLSPTQYREKY